MANPTIHMNGSSPDDLLDNYADAARSLSNAMTDLGRAAPNARDYYYPQGGSAYTDARAEHERHMAALRAARDYVVRLNESVESQVADRRRR